MVSVQQIERDAISVLSMAESVAFGHRTVFSECVWGCVVRRRLHCQKCHVSSDRFEFEGVFPLSFTGNGCYSLEGLLEANLSESIPGDASTLCSHRCGSAVSDLRMQWYLEREPPVFIVKINRASRSDTGLKDRRRVSIPATLTCMRSGPYLCAGVIIHEGTSINFGHYVSLVALDSGRFLRISDRVSTPADRTALSSEEVEKDAYVLVYVRSGYWGLHPSDGTDSVPCERGVEIAGLMQQEVVLPIAEDFSQAASLVAERAVSSDVQSASGSSSLVAPDLLSAKVDAASHRSSKRAKASEGSVNSRFQTDPFLTNCSLSVQFATESTCDDVVGSLLASSAVIGSLSSKALCVEDDSAPMRSSKRLKASGKELFPQTQVVDTSMAQLEVAPSRVSELASQKSVKKRSAAASVVEPVPSKVVSVALGASASTVRKKARATPEVIVEPVKPELRKSSRIQVRQSRQQ
jgi:hypothetical protein